MGAPQDPNELFDVTDIDGQPSGRTKPRGQVHVDGDWHRSVHLWVFAQGDLLFQKRAAGKDTFPGLFDVAVTGHLTSGEGPEALVREAKEELGLELVFAQLEQLGRRWREHQSKAIVDREIQEVFWGRVEVSLSDLSPSAAEVDGVLAVSIDDFDQLTRGARDQVDARFCPTGGMGEVARVVSMADFIAETDGYYGRAIKSIRERLMGGHPPAFRLDADRPKR